MPQERASPCDHTRMRPDDPVLIARFIGIQQAELALSLLDASGIEGYLDQPYTASIAPHYMLGSGGIRLFVRREDREAAIEALAELGEAARLVDPEA